MGEEWGATQPFLFFSDMGEELGDKIREARLKEFQDSPDAKDSLREPPDPMATESFLASKLNWDDREADPHSDWLALYRTLLRIRREEIVPRLSGMEGYAGHYEIIAGRALKVWWTLSDGSVLSMLANLTPEPLDGVNAWDQGRHLWLEGIATGSGLEPWSLVVSMVDARGRTS
jgi:1,4-alpha-glucan branching enzyme